jgi:hypothetical protein
MICICKAFVCAYRSAREDTKGTVDDDQCLLIVQVVYTCTAQAKKYPGDGKTEEIIRNNTE